MSVDLPLLTTLVSHEKRCIDGDKQKEGPFPVKREPVSQTGQGFMGMEADLL